MEERFQLLVNEVARRRLKRSMEEDGYLPRRHDDVGSVVSSSLTHERGTSSRGSRSLPKWRELPAADFSDMRREVVIDGRRIVRREAMQGVFS